MFTVIVTIMTKCGGVYAVFIVIVTVTGMSICSNKSYCGIAGRFICSVSS